MQTPVRGPATNPPLTRRRLAALIGEAFRSGPQSPSELVAYADEQGAQEVALRALKGLPPRRYTELRQLWVHLPEIPVDEPQEQPAPERAHR